jgi:aminomethyltransferase
MLKRTPLYSVHQKLGGRLIEFGGWEMPVQYSSITDEHLAVRNAAGMFDISHMGEVSVSGTAAADFLNFLLTNDIRKLIIGQGQYTLMCNEKGGVVDDLYAYCIGDNDFLLIINASRIDNDVAWMQENWATFPRRDEVRIKNVSEQFGAIALQGPKVVEFIEKVIPGKAVPPFSPLGVTELKKNGIGKYPFDGASVYVGRTGYTGEDGFEIIAEVELLIPLWNSLMEAGQVSGLKPCGLGARDTLRTEVCYPLYGHELDEVTSPVEAGVGFFVAMDKGGFIGRPELAAQKANGTKKKLVAFKMTDKSAPPRPHYPIWSSGGEARQLGEVVSGTQSPSLGIGIGLGYVPPEFAKVGTTLEIEIRGKRFSAIVVKKPIYQRA